MRTRLILNADDFGRSFSINQAVIRAHREGVLTSASLMVTGDAADEAVTLARRTPTLAVGLHLVLAGGRPALPAAAIPHLLDARGLLPADPAAAGARYVLSRSARAELAREVEAQFGLFAATGLPLDHVNGHMHLHLIPGLFAIVAHSAAEYGAGGIRLAGDDLRLSLRYDRQSAGTKLIWAAAFGAFHRSAANRLAALERRDGPRERRDGSRENRGTPGPAFADRIYGLMQTGRMTEPYVLAALNALSSGARRRRASPRRGAGPVRTKGSPAVVEFYFHPDTAPQAEPLGPNPGDLATLLSPAVRRAIEEGGFLLSTYGSIRQGDGSVPEDGGRSSA